MLKKTVYINEEKNEYKFIEKRKKEDSYLNTLFSYMCTTTDNYESINSNYESINDYMILKNGKKIKR